jgi:hypothetical protein
MLRLIKSSFKFEFPAAARLVFDLETCRRAQVESFRPKEARRQVLQRGMNSNLGVTIFATRLPGQSIHKLFLWGSFWQGQFFYMSHIPEPDGYSRPDL